MYEKVKEAIIQLKNAMELENVNPTEGLPEELFVFSSTLISWKRLAFTRWVCQITREIGR